MYALLAILLAFCPRHIDENVSSIYRTEHADKIASMQKGEADQLFAYACPKFISPAIPDYANPEDAFGSMLALQKKVFSREVAQQLALPALRSYLKLYSSVSLDKLAALLSIAEKDTVKQLLVSLVHKNQQLQWKAGLRAIEGELKPAVAMSYCIDVDMVQVQDVTSSRQFATHFLRGILKMNSIESDLIQ